MKNKNTLSLAAALFINNATCADLSTATQQQTESAPIIRDALLRENSIPVAGIAAKGEIRRCIKSGRRILYIYDAQGNVLWSINVKLLGNVTTLKEIKAHCPSCINTTHLKYIKDHIPSKRFSTKKIK